MTFLILGMPQALSFGLNQQGSQKRIQNFQHFVKASQEKAAFLLVTCLGLMSL